MPVKIIQLVQENKTLVGLLAVGGYFLKTLYTNRKRKIFISFHSKNDAKHKNLLNAWQENQDFEFNFHDKSVGISINSDNKDVIKKEISKKLNEANLIFCIIGERTNERAWVNWELEKAKELNKKIIATKIKHNYKSPKCLLNSGIQFIKFEQEAILEAIRKS